MVFGVPENTKEISFYAFARRALPDAKRRLGRTTSATLRKENGGEACKPRPRRKGNGYAARQKRCIISRNISAISG